MLVLLEIFRTGGDTDGNTYCTKLAIQSDCNSQTTCPAISSPDDRLRSYASTGTARRSALYMRSTRHHKPIHMSSEQERTREHNVVSIPPPVRSPFPLGRPRLLQGQASKKIQRGQVLIPSEKPKGGKRFSRNSSAQLFDWKGHRCMMRHAKNLGFGSKMLLIGPEAEVGQGGSLGKLLRIQRAGPVAKQ